MAKVQDDYIISVLNRIDSRTDLQGERLAGIEEHLRTLNGKVLRNQNEIERNRCDIVEGKIQWAKISGMAAGISSVIFAIGSCVIKFLGFI